MRRKKPGPLLELTGAVSRTQEMVRAIGERITTIERLAQERLETRAYWLVARVRDNRIQLARWDGRLRVKWGADPVRATGFQAHSGALTAVQAMRPRKGTTYTTLRVIL